MVIFLSYPSVITCSAANAENCLVAKVADQKGEVMTVNQQLLSQRLDNHFWTASVIVSGDLSREDHGQTIV